MSTHITHAHALEASQWLRPDSRLVSPKRQAAFIARCDALQAVVLQGLSIRLAAREHGVNRTTLASAVEKAFEHAPDGTCHGYRACLPFAIRTRRAKSTPGPLGGQPYALSRLLDRLPTVRIQLEQFPHPLPPGRLPPAFKRLLTGIRAHLKEQGLEHEWPLNQPDKGRRAFSRYVRHYRRERLAAADSHERTVPAPAITSITRVITPAPFDRFEFDAHTKDVNHYLARMDAKGNVVVEAISKVWILVVIDVASKAVMAWKIVYGKGYSALDVAQCFASVFRPWEPKPLIVPNMRYPPGAMMPQALPSGVQTSAILAFDNAKAHAAKLPLATWVTEMHGVLNLGKPYTPEIRATVENFFGYFEHGALRLLPGGYIPSRDLGTEAVVTSPWRAKDHPLHVEAMEQLLDVLITGYNASTQTALQGRSPLEILQVSQFETDRWTPPPRQPHHLRALTTQYRHLSIRGGGRSDKAPHVNFANVAYRHPMLDRIKEYIGQRMPFFIDLEDLRTIVMFDKTLQERLVLRADAPWHLTQHDLTTRQRIVRRMRSGELEIHGAHDAIEAYAAFVRGTQGMADEQARLMQLAATGHMQVAPPVESSPPPSRAALDLPRGGRVSFGTTRDF